MPDTTSEEMLDAIKTDIVNGNHKKQIGEKMVMKYPLKDRYEVAQLVAADSTGAFIKARFRNQDQR